MNDLETRRYEMFVRVRDFGTTHAASFPATTLGGEQYAVVGAAVEDLTRAAASQSSGVGSAQHATASRSVARAGLHEDLQAITQTARAMALDDPGLENKFRMPRSGSDSSLLTAARAFALDAVPLKADFIKHELPVTFLADLQTAINDFEHAVGSQNANRETHVSATVSIDSTIERGMNAVRRLDAIVRNKFRDDPATLAAWESARHVERATRTVRHSKDEGPTPASSKP